MAWQEPKTDWATNPKNPMAEDFNRIEGNIQALKEDIEIKKGDIVNALQSIGMDVSLTDTYEDIANKIKAADQGAKIITPGTSNITIPQGFHNGNGYVKGDSNLKASNIIQGASIFGVSGIAGAKSGSKYPTKRTDYYILNIFDLPYHPSNVAVTFNVRVKPDGPSGVNEGVYIQASYVNGFKTFGSGSINFPYTWGNVTVETFFGGFEARLNITQGSPISVEGPSYWLVSE